MKKVIEFYWETRNLDLVFKYKQYYWIKGLTVNFRSTAFVTNEGQEKELYQMQEDGIIHILETKIQ